MVIRKIIGDTPRTYEEIFTANNQKIIQFSHYPLYEEPTVELDGNPISGTTDKESGVFVADNPMNGTVHVIYKAVWFTDETINSMSVYRNLTIKCLPSGSDTFVMPIPFEPVYYKATDESGATITATYDDNSNTFSATAEELTVSGTFLDVYSTAGTLLLMKANMPEAIRREFSSFTNWADYSQVAKGLQDQAFSWFKMSGENV